MKILFSIVAILVSNIIFATIENSTNTVWTWEQLAQLAGERADKVHIQMLKVAAKRQSVAQSLAWRDPQIRLGHTWGDEWTRQIGDPRTDGKSSTSTLGVRFYVSNPFVNTFLKKSGDAQVEALEACVKAEKYAVYCEVKRLCLDEAFLRRDIDNRKQIVKWTQCLRQIAEEKLANDVATSPLAAVLSAVTCEQAQLEIETTQQKLTQTRQQIAYLTGVALTNLTITYTPPTPPSTNVAYDAILTEAAFMRRPDLQSALFEYQAAQANVSASRAAHIPWFEFVEGTYSHQTDKEDNWGEKTGFLRQNSHEDDWQIRTAIKVPIFTWFGESVKKSKTVAEIADTRVQALRQFIQQEIITTRQAFRAADSRFIRLSDTSKDFIQRVETKLTAIDSDKATTISPEEIYKTRLGLVKYKRLYSQAEYDWVHWILMLETVTGGPLP